MISRNSLQCEKYYQKFTKREIEIIRYAQRKQIYIYIRGEWKLQNNNTWHSLLNYNDINFLWTEEQRGISKMNLKITFFNRKSNTKMRILRVTVFHIHLLQNERTNIFSLEYQIQRIHLAFNWFALPAARISSNWPIRNLRSIAIYIYRYRAILER